MTIDDIPAGREMDALVAEKVMGWKRVEMSGEAWAGDDNQWHDDYMGSKDGVRTLVPYYSRDISAAWEVVEKLIANGYTFVLDFNDYETHAGQNPQEDMWFSASVMPDKHSGESWADTAPLAICIAALKATDSL